MQKVLFFAKIARIFVSHLNLFIMTRITTNRTNPVFVAGVKSEMAARKQRFSRYFSIITGTKSNAIAKLKQMNA